MTSAWAELEEKARSLPAADAFSANTVESLPGPAGRYLRAAIQEGTPLAAGARLSMRGSIKIGRWLPFRARQILVPSLGTVWEARVAGVISGSDRYVSGQGGMDWSLLGLAKLVHEEGADVSRSSAERAAGESIWVPTALARPGAASWSSTDDERVNVTVHTDGNDVVLEHDLEPNGQLRASRFERWGDPDKSGIWQANPFGVEVNGYGTFGGVTIPTRGRAGWYLGTPRWPDGAFFRYEITNYELLA
ncbi:MAG: DUF6544 family protein [Microthrixaceae bacterium]